MKSRSSGLARRISIGELATCLNLRRPFERRRGETLSLSPFYQRFTRAAQQLLAYVVDLFKHVVAGSDLHHFTVSATHPSVAVTEDHHFGQSRAQIRCRCVEDSILEKEGVAGAESEFRDNLRIHFSPGNRLGSEQPMGTRREEREA